MSLWPRLRSALFGGALANKETGFQRTGPTSGRSDADISVSDERAMSVSAVWACIRLIVQSGATMPIGFFRRVPDGREALDEDHPLVQILKYKPNLYMSGKQFRQAMWMQRVMWGNAYARKLMNGSRLVGLMPLNPAFMAVDRESTGLKYRYSTDSGITEYDDSEILHIKGFSADGIVGLSPLGYMRHALGISVSADRKAATSFNSMPNFGLKVKGWPDQEQREQLRELYHPNTAMTGDGNFWIFPGDMEPERLSLPPNDLQMLESRQFQVSEICRFYGVPAVMVDGNAGATSAWPASYEQQVLSFLTFTLKPYLEEFEDQVVAALVDPGDRKVIFAEHNVEGLLRTDSAARAEFYSKMVQNGVMTRNEIRKKENLPPLKGGDELTIQVNLTPAEMLRQVGQDAA